MTTKLFRNVLVGVSILVAFGACTAEETVIEPTDFKFDGTCVNCHSGLTAGHVHLNYKLRCVDCHGGNDQIVVAENAFTNTDLSAGGGGFRDPELLKQVHVLPDPNIARFFYANGVDDDNDGLIDEPLEIVGTTLNDQGEIFEPGIHGEGPGEFMDMELNRDLNYTRFYNPGDLRIATISCGSKSRGAFDGGGNGSCHQQTIDIVRRSIMVNQAAVTNGAYYGNESARAAVKDRIEDLGDPRFGAFSYALDYADPNSVDSCITVLVEADRRDPRKQPTFNKQCLQDRAADIDNQFPETQGGNSVVAGALGNRGVAGEQPSNFEIAQGVNTPITGKGTTVVQEGAGDSRLPWGGSANSISDGHEQLEPLLSDFLIPPGALATAPGGVPDPVDNILRTFRAYYPLNYPGSTTNFNFTFGTSILPEVKRFKTGSPYGRGHSSGCSACHTPYAYDGSRQPQKIRKENPTDTNNDGVLAEDEVFDFVVDPTTKHREFDPANDIREINGVDRLVGRPVGAAEVALAGGVAQGAVDLNNDGVLDGEQQKTYSQGHTTTAKIDTDTCGLCHGFVTRINYAYQGMAEEEQRDALSRRAPIEFETANGTNVIILDSWVREDNDVNNDGVADAQPTLIVPAGVDIVNRARTRDADLAKQGIIVGVGGCVPAVFSEDCNNNGELDTAVELKKLDIDGNVVNTVTVNEDLNGNGKLDLIDRLPREKAIDGRQVRYIYGGRNGSTRQMDVHFQVGMHCIDCHFLQDVHGDGNVYSTNWDNIEIECEDCHGTNTKSMADQGFKTSGPNGGNALNKAVNEDLLPFFESDGGQIIQRSRVTRGLSWVVPQTADINKINGYAKEAHAPTGSEDAHIGEQFQGTEYETANDPTSAMTKARVDCATCHNGWITNCLGCHVEINVADKQRNFLDATDCATLPCTVQKSAGENEIWLSNKHNAGHINFQLLGLLRAPFVLGAASKSDQGRLVNVRSSMQAHAGASDETGDTIRENLTFTTFQAKDANSGRVNVATSGVVMNQTMPHTVRPAESRGCEMCHPMVNDNGQVRNEHVLAQTYGLGTGSLPFTGDWIFAAGTNGMEMFEYKQERELGNNLIAGASTRFPGMIVNPLDKVAANVEPAFNGGNGINVGSIGNDVLLIRNFNSAPEVGGFQAPTTRDLAVIGIDPLNGTGKVMFVDVSIRGHRTLSARPTSDNGANVFVVTLPQAPRSLAHIASDVSDPFVYAAVGTSGVSVIRIDDAPGVGIPAVVVTTVPLPNNRNANKVALAGDFLYVGSLEGGIDVFNINDPERPQLLNSVQVGQSVNDIAIAGFIMYVGTAGGLAILSLDDPENPGPPRGASQIPVVPLANAIGVYPSEGHVFVAAGADGIVEIDARTPAEPVNLGAFNIVDGVDINAVDVIVSQLPGQRWVIGLQADGNVVGVKLDNTLTKYERCYPDPGAADCILELEMFDPTRSGKDPSFDPLSGTFDAIDPSSDPVFLQTRAIIGNGKRLARPVLFESIGTLSGRRYRDSFMPGAGVMSLPVFQSMRSVEVCELQEGGSTNPSGIGELGYFTGGACAPFSQAAARKKPTCNEKKYGPGIRGILCEQSKTVKTADPTKPVPAKPPARTRKSPQWPVIPGPKTAAAAAVRR